MYNHSYELAEIPFTRNVASFSLLPPPTPLGPRLLPPPPLHVLVSMYELFMSPLGVHMALNTKRSLLERIMVAPEKEYTQEEEEEVEEAPLGT